MSTSKWRVRDPSGSQFTMMKQVHLSFREIRFLSFAYKPFTIFSHRFDEHWLETGWRREPYTLPTYLTDEVLRCSRVDKCIRKLIMTHMAVYNGPNLSWSLHDLAWNTPYIPTTIGLIKFCIIYNACIYFRWEWIVIYLLSHSFISGKSPIYKYDMPTYISNQIRQNQLQIIYMANASINLICYKYYMNILILLWFSFHSDYHVADYTDNVVSLINYLNFDIFVSMYVSSILCLLYMYVYMV